MAASTFFCSKPWTGFEIEHDGTVRQCCMTKVWTCGNIHQQSIQEIWNGEIYQDLRRKMAAGQWQDICKAECPRLHGQLNDPAPMPVSQEFASNYALSEAEIEQRAIVLKSMPRFWKITHSTRCNIDCVMCYQDRNDLRSLPEKFYKEMEDFNAVIQEIQLIGGETFAIKRFREFLSRFPKTQFPDVLFSLVTNGTVYDDAILDIVRAVRVSWLSISVDAATDETYSRIRRGGNLPQTKEGIAKWTSLGRETGFPVLLSFTVMRDNINEIAQFVEFTRQYHIDCLFGIIQGDKGNQNVFDKNELRDSVRKATELAARYQDEMPFANLTLKALSPYCN